jgi:hypothetical protein
MRSRESKISGQSAIGQRKYSALPSDLIDELECLEWREDLRVLTWPDVDIGGPDMCLQEFSAFESVD